MPTRNPSRPAPPLPADLCPSLNLNVMLSVPVVDFGGGELDVGGDEIGAQRADPPQTRHRPAILDPPQTRHRPAIDPP